MSVINTNVKSMFAQAALQTNERSMTTAMNQLSTGKRTYSAAVDAAGLSLSEKLTSQIRGSQMAVRNMNDAISFLQTAEGALGEIANMAQRMYELAIQYADGTLSSDQQTDIKSEMNELSTAITSVKTNTKWNATATADYSITTTVAADGTTATFAKTTSIGTVPTSASAASAIETFIETIASQRGEAGAQINRLGYMVDNLNNVAANLAASRSRVQDTDYAKASAELARTQIINQAATAMLAQANQQPQVVLSLLQ
ncbi:MAG: Flagellin [Pseudomonadota bacterium]|jgi:flagellin